MGNGTSSSIKSTNPPAGIIKLNESVWQLHRGTDIPEVEILFFHGLQLRDFENAFWKTWLSRDGSVVWPQKWLSESFRNARILSISYNSSAMAKEGQLEMYTLGENLVNDIILNSMNIGQKCPVVLVGHSLGGLVIKQFVLHAYKMRGLYHPSMNQAEINKIDIFLNQNVRGVFYYATPHQGARLADLALHIPGSSPYLKLLKTLDTERTRINEEFRKRRVISEARASAIGENRKIGYKAFKAVVVEEASARHDIEDYYTATLADHFNVCKPENKQTAIFTRLCEFITKATLISNSDNDLEKRIAYLRNTTIQTGSLPHKS